MTAAESWEAPSQAELEQLGVLAEDGSQICPTDKFTRADMDAFLLENTGLTLAQTNQVDLDAFDYLPEYDAYYHTHGRHQLPLRHLHQRPAAGRLYPALLEGFLLRRRDQRVRHPAGRGDGQYWFVSHLLLDSVTPLPLPTRRKIRG